MRGSIAMLALAIVAALPAAHAQECFSIEDPDRKNACLASAKKDESYCFKIQTVDQRNACLEAVKADRGYCFKIQNNDLRNDCLANTPR